MLFCQDIATIIGGFKNDLEAFDALMPGPEFYGLSYGIVTAEKFHGDIKVSWLLRGPGSLSWVGLGPQGSWNLVQRVSSRNSRGVLEHCFSDCCIFKGPTARADYIAMGMRHLTRKCLKRLLVS